MSTDTEQPDAGHDQSLVRWRVVRHHDGKVIAITRGEECVNRAEFETWDEFRQECASVLFCSLDRDEESEHFERLRRIAELESELETLRGQSSI